MSAPFRLATLAEALRRRISEDTDLLGHVLRMMSERPSASSSLDDWVPIDQIETATGGKISESSARWLARNRAESGTGAAFRKLGRKLFVNPTLLVGLQDGGGA
jgi:hypothetical protein